MSRPIYHIYTITLLYSLLLAACGKGDLQRQPSTDFDVPQTPEALQALLDNDRLFGQTPAAGILSAERFYFTDSWVDFLLPTEFNLYSWQAAIYSPGETVKDWDLAYEQIFVANQVLHAMEQLPEGTASPAAYNAIQGNARFLRAHALWQLTQLYAPPYDSLQADALPGIPLPTTAEVNPRLARASLRQTYRQIEADLLQAAVLLPTAIDKSRPNRPGIAAAWGLLARLYLSMHLYQQAGSAASNSLQQYKTLTDYRTLDTTTFIPFNSKHPEIIYQSSILEDTRFLAGLVDGSHGFIDSNLYRSYAVGDLRRSLFFKEAGGQSSLKGSYTGTAFPFTGIATDEIFLIRAESLAKTGQTAAALNDLDTLLSRRFATGYFIPRKTNQADTALVWIRAEREKELAFRGQRWTDLRRLNKEGNNIPLSRIVKGTTYTLDPDSRRYTLPIPPLAVKEGLPQNPR